MRVDSNFWPLLLGLVSWSACGPPSSDAPAPVQRAPAGPFEVVSQASGVEAPFRGLAVWGRYTAWVSGGDGTVLKTTDAGETWERLAIPETGELGFRDIHMVDADTVLLMSVGPGPSSRIYKTTDGGASWSLRYQNREETAFFNGFAFWDEKAGILTSDPFDGKPFLLRTEDAGDVWERVGAGTLPPLVEGEYGFAASGTNVATAGAGHVWVATGGAAARVFRSADRGDTWEVFETPIGAGTETSGIFSIAFRDEDHGVAVGGDFQDPETDRGNVAWTADGGRTWTLAEAAGGMPQKACVQYLGEGRYLAAGRTGLAYSDDDGLRWRKLSGSPYFTIGFHAPSATGWLAGGEGRIGRFTLR